MMIELVSAVKISLLVGFASTTLAFIPAIFFGWVLARYEFKGKIFLNLILFFPLVSPPVVTGFLLLKIFGRNHFLGQFLESVGIQIPFSILGAIIAAMVVGFPLFIMSIRSAFSHIDSNLEKYAHSAGYSPWQTFFKVTLPLSWPGILAGCVLCFARSLGEFGATVVLAGNIEGKTRTIPMAIYSLLDSPSTQDNSNIFLMVSLLISFCSLILYEIFIHKYWKKIEWRK